MCLKWDFFGIEWNCATICKQLQIRTISENIFSLILMVYRHRKLGYPNSLISDQRASPIILQQWQTCKHCASRKEEALYGDY